MLSLCFAYLLLRRVRKCSSSVHVQILQKCLLYAINGGVDAKTKVQVGAEIYSYYFGVS